jgi:hypothetical protein
MNAIDHPQFSICMHAYQPSGGRDLGYYDCDIPTGRLSPRQGTWPECNGWLFGMEWTSWWTRSPGVVLFRWRDALHILAGGRIVPFASDTLNLKHAFGLWTSTFTVHEAGRVIRTHRYLTPWCAASRTMECFRKIGTHGRGSPLSCMTRKKYSES